jgi:uncharacterized repeat protein (TIGR02543 family)
MQYREFHYHHNSNKKIKEELQVKFFTKKSKSRVAGSFLALLMAVSAVPTVPVFAAGTQVGTYSELKRALADSSINYIELSRDITLSAVKEYVNSSRSSLVIDGNGHTITDAESTDMNRVFTLSSRGKLNSITIKNTKFVGKNDNGFILVPDSSAYKCMKMTYDNVTYTGPQAIEAKYCDVELIDSTINLIPGYCKDVDEVVQALNITLTGDIEIEKDAPKNDAEVFGIWHSSGSLTVSEGANVNVTSNQKSSRTYDTVSNDSGFVQVLGSGSSLNFKADSTFFYEGNNFFQTDSAFRNITIGENAIVDITTHGDFHDDDTIFMVDGKMDINDNATLNIRALNNVGPNDKYDLGESEPALQLKGTAVLTLNDPKEVFIYNSSRDNSNTGLAWGPWGCDVRIIVHSADSVEYWNLNKNSIDNLGRPTYDWRNRNGWGGFYMASRILGATVLEAFADGYNGSTAANKTTMAVKNVNVVSINGGRGNYLPKTATVKFNSMGGTPTPAAQEVVLGGKVIKPADPTRTGYTFAGWYTNDSCSNTSLWDFDNDVVNGSMTLYAKWIVAPKQVLVQFNMNGGTPQLSSVSVVVGSTITKPADPTREGYTFDGWYQSATFAGAPWNFATPVMVGMTLNAKWVEAPKYFAVSFVPNGGTPAPAGQVVLENTTITEPAAMTREGYTFEGWYDTVDFTGAAWDFTTDLVDDNMILYAKWTQD